MRLTAEEKKKISDARSSGGGNNLNHGVYILMLDKWFFKRGFKGLADVHEFVVVSSEKAVGLMEGDKKVDVEPNAVDSSSSTTFSYAGNALKMAPVNTTQFLLAMLGKKDEELDDDEKEAARLECTNDDPNEVDGEGNKLPVNPCRGMLVGAETVPYFTKETKKWIVRINWKTIDPIGEGENTFEKAKERWAAYEARVKAKGQQKAIAS